MGCIGVVAAINTNPSAILLVAAILTAAQGSVFLISFKLDITDQHFRKPRAGLLCFNLFATLTYPILLFIALWKYFQVMNGINSELHMS